MVDSQTANDEAISEATELAADDFWKAAFAGAVPTLTVAVRDLTPGGTDYFLIHFQKGGRSTGLMLVNRKTGIVDASTGIEKDGEELPAFIPPTQARSKVTPDVVLDDGRIVHPPTGTPTVVLLWMHSRESQSPFQPFYWLRWKTLGVFLRVDGKFYDRLTPTDGMPARHA
jgi:hypothetical protein